MLGNRVEAVVADRFSKHKQADREKCVCTPLHLGRSRVRTLRGDLPVWRALGKTGPLCVYQLKRDGRRKEVHKQ